MQLPPSRSLLLLLMLAGSLTACGTDGAKPVAGGSRNDRDPATDPDHDPGASNGGDVPAANDGEPNPGTDGCGLGCSTVQVGQGGAGFDLDQHPHEGVIVDADGSLILGADDKDRTGFIWIANTGEQTVSKIDTATMKEVGRYRVGAPDPSRTSVSVTGDAYVGSRAGNGLTKISVLGANCADTNNDGAITTSSGPADVLPFGQDDCVLWFTQLTDSIRGVAAQDILGTTKVTPVAGGEPMITVTESEHYVWAGGGTLGRLFKLRGDTGAVVLETQAPRGIYGLALDGSGLLWMTGGAYWGGSLAVVDTRTCLDEVSCNVPSCNVSCSETSCPDTCDGAVKANITLSPDSAYGVTVDCKQRVWLGGSGGPIKRYDPSAPADQRLTVAPESAKTSGIHGIAADAKGFIWGAASGQGVLRLDAETMLQSTFIRTDYGAKGIAIAANGDVWAITQSTMAHVVRPGPALADNMLLPSAVTGFVSPYTYSDMTGEQLRLATNAPGRYRRVFEGCAGGTTRWQDVAFDTDVPQGTIAILRARGAASKAELANATPILLSVAPFQADAMSLEGTSLADAAFIELEVELIVEGGRRVGRCERDRTTPRLKALSLNRVCSTQVQ